MEKRGKKVYLTIQEQILSGYPSPIDVDEFDKHKERVAAETEIDRLEAMQAADDDELTHEERASLPANLERARMKSKITRGIGATMATETIVVGGDS